MTAPKRWPSYVEYSHWCHENGIKDGDSTWHWMQQFQPPAISDEEIEAMKDALEAIASGTVYADGKPGKTPKTRARAALERMKK